nr:nuclear poly(A) polymerase 3 [Ipomoea batatas]
MIFCFLFKFVSMSSDDDELGFDAITRGGKQAEKCHSQAKKKKCFCYNIDIWIVWSWGFIIQSDIDVLCVVPCFANMVDAKVPLMRFKFDGIPVDLPYAQLKVVSIPEVSSDAISLMAATNVNVFNPFFMRNIDESNWKSLSGIRANRSMDAFTWKHKWMLLPGNLNGCFLTPVLLNINGCFLTPVLFGRVTMAWLITVKERNLQKDHLFCRGIRGVAMSPEVIVAIAGVSSRSRRKAAQHVGMDLSKDAQAQKLAYNIGYKWSVVFATAVSWIWRWHNDIAFTGMEATRPGKIEQIGEYSKESNIIFANLQHGRNSANNQDVIL